MWLEIVEICSTHLEVGGEERREKSSNCRRYTASQNIGLQNLCTVSQSGSSRIPSARKQMAASEFINFCASSGTTREKTEAETECNRLITETQRMACTKINRKTTMFIHL